MMRRTTVLCVVGAVALGIVPATPGVSGGPAAPSSVLVRGLRRQRALLTSYCWTSRPDATGTTTAVCADGVSDYPDRGLRIKVGRRARIRFRWPRRPDGVGLRAYRRVENERFGEFPSGPGRRLGFRLRPHRRNDRIVAWDAVFVHGRRRRHYYIDAFVKWSRGDGFYQFHTKTDR